MIPIMMDKSRTDKPLMMVIIDTEEDFDWSRPFKRFHNSTASVKGQLKAQNIFEKFGITPTYVIDYCIATDPYSISFFKELYGDGHCSIGAHLHPWVNPPYDEPINNFNSFHGNLPENLELAKIRTLDRKIEENFQLKPRMFKAGRYGFGPNTLKLLKQENYIIDCSFVPYSSFKKQGGPSFIGTPDQPFWLDAEKDFLEIPMSKYFIGKYAKFGEYFQQFYDNRILEMIHFQGILKRIGVERSVLTPEGVPLEEMINLIESMKKSGKMIFTLTYHSPSLLPGNTPYVQSQKDLANFLLKLETVFLFFSEALGGRFVTPFQLYNELQAE